MRRLYQALCEGPKIHWENILLELISNRNSAKKKLSRKRNIREELKGDKKKVSYI